MNNRELHTNENKKNRKKLASVLIGIMVFFYLFLACSLFLIIKQFRILIIAVTAVVLTLLIGFFVTKKKNRSLLSKILLFAALGISILLILAMTYMFTMIIVFQPG